MAALNLLALMVSLPLSLVACVAAWRRWWSPVTRCALRVATAPPFLLYLATAPDPSRVDVVLAFAAGLILFDAGLDLSRELEARRKQIAALERLLRRLDGWPR